MGFNNRGALTGEQKAILQYASEGYTYRGIAMQLGPDVTITMVRGRLTWAFKKLGAKSMTHAVALAMADGSIPGPVRCNA